MPPEAKGPGPIGPEQVPPNFYISKFHGEVSSEQVRALNVAGLFASGLGLTGMRTDKQLFDLSLSAFSVRNSSSYFARSASGEAIASLAMWDMPEHSTSSFVGPRFWEELTQRDHALVERMREEGKPPSAARLVNMVTSPDHAGTGIQQRLVRESLRDKHPDIVVAETNNPAAAAIVGKVYGEAGYRVFLGNIEITPDAPFAEDEKPHEGILQAYSRVLPEGWELTRAGLILKPPEVEDPEVMPQVDLSRLPEKARDLFDLLIRAQKVYDTQYIIKVPLIAVKKELLELAA